MPLKLEQIHFYDPAAETRRTRQNLPHWEQRCVCAFSTWRMADSLPAEFMQGWLDERDAWLREHELDPGSDNRPTNSGNSRPGENISRIPATTAGGFLSVQ